MSNYELAKKEKKLCYNKYIILKFCPSALLNKEVDEKNFKNFGAWNSSHGEFGSIPSG